MRGIPKLEATDASALGRKDFQSDQDVRWCPGCGDYSILAQVHRTLPKLGIPRENFAFISGIGCSSRFPYYMDTYGMHSIHGRAPAIASGLKAARPELSVWVITGDGDSLSIGGNHFLHVLRRNFDINILLFNNRIYGLTKGQYSPTSPIGTRTKSSPMGAIDHPFNPISVALGADATFVARAIDTDAKMMQEMLLRATAHQGTSLIEIFQNCPIFNDGAFAEISDRRQRDETQLRLTHGEPMRFGAGGSKGIALDSQRKPMVVEVESHGVENLLIHDETDHGLAFMLSRFEPPEFPTPVGVVVARERSTYETAMSAQLEAAAAEKNGGVQDLLDSGATWTVEGVSMQRIKRPISDFISGQAATVSIGATVCDAVSRMAECDTSCATVVDADGMLVGIFTGRDFLNRVAGEGLVPKDTLIQDVMTHKPHALAADDCVSYAIHRMSEGGYRHVPIIEDGKPVALISVRDVIAHLSELFSEVDDGEDPAVSREWIDLGGG